MAEPARVLLSAYQCGPGMGSVSQIGWEWYSRLAGKTPVTLLTHVRNRAALEAAGAPLPGTEVVYIDTEWFAGPLYRFARFLFRRSEHPVFLISSLDFFVYDHVALRTARARIAAGDRFDLVHQVTPVSPLAATRLHRLGLPLILGPWNGGLRSPENFPDIMRAESGWVYKVRRLGHLADRLFGSTRQARLILVATRATAADLPPDRLPKTRFMLENGVDLDLFPPAPWPQRPSAEHPLEVLFVGRLLPVKGVTMLLDAVAAVRAKGPVRLTVVGSGPEEEALKSHAEALGIAGLVRFTGNLPLASVGAEMARAHVFCLPSVRESGGAVLLEAMAVGRPVVAVDYGGPAEIVDGEVGALLPATGRTDVVAALTACLSDAMARPETWRRRGEAGRQRVLARYSWAAKIDEALEIYRECLSAP
jgi:glycosyltransferase involved in cell wall biosynthesis